MNNLVILQVTLRHIQDRIGDERLSNILWCIGIILATLLLKRPLSLLLVKLSAAFARRFDDQQQGKLFQELTLRPMELLLQTLLYYVAINQLTILLNQVILKREYADHILEIRISDISDRIFMLLLILFLVLVISRIIDFIFHGLIARAFAADNQQREQLLPLVKEVVKIVLWTLGLFWVLGSVFGVNIPALVTGLGIGGVAIALAAKETVENFFAAFTILTDKPFQSGDVVKLGNLEGSVEQIGFRSTRLRNGDGSLYIIPNKKLVNENLENLTQRERRKVRVVFHLKYGITAEALRELIAGLQDLVAGSAQVRKPVHVFLESFGEGSFQLSLSYFLPEPVTAGATADSIKQEINLNAYALIEAFTGADRPVADRPDRDGEESLSDGGKGTTE